MDEKSKLFAICQWLNEQPETTELPVGPVACNVCNGKKIIPMHAL